MMLYSIKRFLIEYLRADGNILLMGLTVFQVFSVIMFLAAVALAVFSRKRTHA
jgi:prolipoprotein diacylglyceryltransferase